MITTKKSLTAIDTLKKELAGVQIEQMLCVDDYDIVRPWMRNKYNELTKRAKLLKDSIDYLVALKEERNDINKTAFYREAR